MPKGPFSIEKLGLRSAWQLPTESLYKVLCHLNEPGSPRLYVGERGGVTRASLSNSEHEPGWHTRCSIHEAIDKKWVILDQEETRKLSGRLKVYRISARGQETIAQYRARRYFYDVFLPQEVPKLIDIERKKAGLGPRLVVSRAKR